MLVEYKGKSKNVIIPNGVKSIDNYAFSGCESLISVTIPDGVESIGKNAFWGCKNLINIIIPDSVKQIGNGAFAYCENLLTVQLPNKLTKIERVLFSHCSKLKKINIPVGVKSIEEIAFRGCEKLENISLPDGLEKIGEVAFDGCSSIVIPDSVIEMDSWAFGWCVNLKSVRIGSGLRFGGILDHAFYMCKNLENIEFSADILEVGISVYDFAFWGCEKLTKIFAPLNGVGVQAFARCTNLTMVNCEKSSTIDEGAFAECFNLKDVIFTDELTHMGDQAFFGCKNIIQLENGIEYVGKWVIGYDSTMSPFILRDDTVGIAERAFAGCNSLVSITIPTLVGQLCYSVFTDCRKLESIVLPNSLYRIDDWAFFNCNQLSKISYNGTVKKWNRIAKETGWNGKTGNFVVECTDGTITKQTL